VASGECPQCHCTEVMQGPGPREDVRSFRDRRLLPEDVRQLVIRIGRIGLRNGCFRASTDARHPHVATRAHALWTHVPPAGRRKAAHTLQRR
jgi:hypothetical protein